jgi:hypothetical protein
VPLTIGLALLVAVMQVLAYVKKDENWERLSRFFGVLFLINFAMGVVTGIVQEFQFGMNWSNYSVFVGNIFGAPLAMEGLLAFFAESTFIGLWLFGRNRLPALVHTLSICVVSLDPVAVQTRRAAGLRARALHPVAAGRLHRHPVRGQHVRLAVHRDGAAAVDRVRADEDWGRDLAERLGHRRGPHPGRLRAALHGARGDRHRAHVPGGPARAWA